MAYTVRFVLFDLGGLFSVRLPTLAGTLAATGLPAPATATATAAPFSITFASLSNPPGSPGTLLITDPAGPGDFFRSGPVTTWPVEPVAVSAGTAILPIPFAMLSIPTPMRIPIPGGAVAGVGAAAGFLFTPFNLTLSSIILSSSSTAGAIRASFRGVISFFTLVIPRRTAVTGILDLTLTPSGNAASPPTIINVSASNLSFTTGFITPLSTPVLALLAPLFSGALSGSLTALVNAAIAPRLATAVAMLPLTPSGAPFFSAAATVSARRILVLRSGVILQAVLSELVAVPPTAPIMSGPD